MALKTTPALKAHGVKKNWWKADDSDDAVRKTALDKVAGDEMTLDELAKLTREAPAPGTGRVAQLEKQLAELTAKITGKKIDIPGRIEEHLLNPGGQTLPDSKTAGNPSDVFRQALNQDDGSERIEFVEAVKQHDTSRKGLYYPARDEKGFPHMMHNSPVIWQGRQMNSASDRDKAIAQAWLKYTLNRQARAGMHAMVPWAKMTDHDKQLVQWCLRNSQFEGGYGGDPDGPNGCTHIVERRRLNEMEIAMFDVDRWSKAPLIDDSTSGGSDLVPVEFDDAVITIPLLFGQLFPFVEVIDIARGSHIQGGSIGNPTFGYTAEGTQVTPFDATAYVGQFNNTIYPSVAAMQIGRDFQQDSPANIGQLVIDAFGRASMNWLDNAIANGNGTNQPQGALQFATPIVYSAENPTVGPVTVADYEALKFSIPLEYRNAEGGRNVYLGNDSTYAKTVGIPVGSDDQRRVFGMKEDYTILGWPFKVNNTVANNQLAAVNLGYYRLYRRLGMTTVVERTGYTLQLTNTDLIICRMRWAGKMKLGNAISVCSNLQS